MRPRSWQYLSGGSLLLLTACAQHMRTEPPGASIMPAEFSQQNMNPGASLERPVPAVLAPPHTSNAEIISGTGNFVASTIARAPAPSPALGDNGITLSFTNADVRDVAKAVLGDFLKLNYTIGANVQGSITVETSAPVARNAILPLFEQALSVNALALVNSGGIYKIVPVADAPKEAGISPVSTAGPSAAGYGVQVVPLKFVGAAEMARLLTPLAPAKGILQVDPARNLIVVEGTERERAQMLETVALFDVSWLAGMSFALYTPQYTDAQGLARELVQIIGGANSPIAGVIRLVPIERLNTVLAISPQPRYLQELQAWVDRLDRPGQGTDKRAFVYHVQNGRASDLATVLLRAFGGANGRTGGQGPLAQDGPSPFEGFGPPGSPPMGGPGPQAPRPPPILAPDGTNRAPNIGAIGSINVTPDERNNALVIIASPQEYSAIQATLRELDIVPLQVMLEAAIAEVTLTDDLQYGVQYFYKPGTDHQIVLSNSNSSAIGPAFPGFSYAFSQGSNIRVVLDALAAITNVEVISSPQLLVLNNQPATLQVGDQVPIVTQQAVSTLTTGAPLVNSIQYQATGVILKVTPRVNQGGMVMMDISQEVSDVAATTTSSIDSPTIRQRKIESSVAVKDNETIALGGLIMDGTTRGRSGIPFLQNIPVLGGLFSTTDNNRTRTELMVLITPHVVDSLEKARSVTEELRRRLSAVQFLFDGTK